MLIHQHPRIYLSPPHMSGQELEFVQDAIESNWVAPLGPHVDAFEKEFASYIGLSHAAAVSSGTAALHLSMRLLGVQPGDNVICPTLSFCATANAITYEGGIPVFVDSERSSWNLDPDLLANELEHSGRMGKLPKAVIAVDLYGQCADYNRIMEICDRFEVPLVEDAAEALGSSYENRNAGCFGKMGIFSFNGNKIITTSGGGMIVSEDASLVEKARYLSTQARDPVPHYQHSTTGFNYRLSNILAAIGRAQLQVLPDRIEARRRNFHHYKTLLGDLPGIEFMPEAPYGKSTRWLTCLTIDSSEFGVDSETVRLKLEENNIEARPIWKPLHLQPIFSGCRLSGGDVAQDLFEHGLCLPSGSNLSESDLERITSIILEARD
jgi:dTDP-4-amino-4,6-dideoxygalactose transaminase